MLKFQRQKPTSISFLPVKTSQLISSACPSLPPPLPHPATSCTYHVSFVAAPKSNSRIVSPFSGPWWICRGSSGATGRSRTGRSWMSHPEKFHCRGRPFFRWIFRTKLQRILAHKTVGNFHQVFTGISTGYSNFSLF